MDSELTPLEKAKLIIIDTDNFSDEEALQAFLDLEITSTADIDDITKVIVKHRPAIVETLAKYLTIVLP